jgi:hypothetical protein
MKSMKSIHAQRAFLFYEKPLVDAIDMKVVIARCE